MGVVESYNNNKKAKKCQSFKFFEKSIDLDKMDANEDGHSLMTKKYHVKIEEGFETNPWSVEDASAFLKYCCPECDYQILNLQLFSDHALKNHDKSTALFGVE